MPVKKTEIKSVKTIKKTAVKAEPRVAAFSIPVYSLAGKETGTMALPKEIFGKKTNKKLLSQALRVYMANKKVFTGSTKTRGKVHGTTAKVWKQKGTGRARHGARTAPIFVGGGIAFGPQPRDIKLELPKKMKKAALLNALSLKLLDKDILGITGLDAATGKTKEMAKFMDQLSGILYKDKKMKSTLIITGEKMDNVVRSASNIQEMDILSVNLLNAYDVLKHSKLLITKEAVEKLESRIKSPEARFAARRVNLAEGGKQESMEEKQSA